MLLALQPKAIATPKTMELLYYRSKQLHSVIHKDSINKTVSKKFGLRSRRREEGNWGERKPFHFCGRWRPQILIG